MLAAREQTEKKGVNSVKQARQLKSAGTAGEFKPGTQVQGLNAQAWKSSTDATMLWQHGTVLALTVIVVRRTGWCSCSSSSCGSYLGAAGPVLAAVTAVQDCRSCRQCASAA
jgi:hypothetical protein